MTLPLAHALDLFQHWVSSETNVSDESRTEIRDTWTAPPTFTRDVPEEESWAPSWWHGDEDAAMSGVAAAAKLKASRRG